MAILEKISAPLLLLAGILGAIAVISRNVKNGFKATNDFIKHQKEESETIIETKERVDKFDVAFENIEESLRSLAEQSKTDYLERIKHNIISFSSDIRNDKEQPEVQWQYILEKCDWYKSDGHNGYVKPHIEYIMETYAKRLKEA